jgi:hypothetical protein
MSRHKSPKEHLKYPRVPLSKLKADHLRGRIRHVAQKEDDVSISGDYVGCVDACVYCGLYPVSWSFSSEMIGEAVSAAYLASIWGSTKCARVRFRDALGGQKSARSTPSFGSAPIRALWRACSSQRAWDTQKRLAIIGGVVSTLGG